MSVDVKNLPSSIEQTIYSQNGIEIKMTVSTNYGEVIFTAYINGNYVPFSRDNTLFSTVRVLNNELSMGHNKI